DHRGAPLDPAVELRGDLLGRAIQGGHGLRPQARLVAARETEHRDADEVGTARTDADVRAAPPDAPGRRRGEAIADADDLPDAGRSSLVPAPATRDADRRRRHHRERRFAAGFARE